MTSVFYCTREDVKAALDSKETARNNTLIDDAIDAASRSIEGLCKRRFYPELATRYFEWPNYSFARPWRLYLGKDELVSASAVVSGGVTIAATDYFLEPSSVGPPYSSVEIDRASSAAFNATTTSQRSVAITGLYGYTADEASATALNGGINVSVTAVSVLNSAAVGIGSIVRVDDERMLVTGKYSVDTGQAVATTGLTANANNETVLVASGAALNIGELITIDSERMLIVDITGNSLTVKRAYDGSTLAVHAVGASLYAPRGLTVTRGALGTTAAAHLTAATAYRHIVPALVRQLCKAEALVMLRQQGAGYSSQQGSEGRSSISTNTLEDLRKSTYAAHGRRTIRVEAV